MSIVDGAETFAQDHYRTKDQHSRKAQFQVSY